MIYLLIDNCTLLQLVNKNGYNEYITELNNFVNNEKVKLLTHKLIIEEWERHKERDRNRKERTLLYNVQKNENGNTSSSLLPSNTFVNTTHLELQTQQIDALLSNAIILQTPEGIKNEFPDRFRNRLPPFQNKINSQNDWEIFGTACNYCELYDIKVLFFLSSNYTDFADESEINCTIHPLLQERFEKVKIQYYRNYSDFFKESGSFDSIPHQLIPYQLISNEKYTYKSSIKKSDLESIYYLYNDLYKEISFIPTHILRRYYPFADNERSNAYYHTFTMHNVKDSLLEFFSTIEIREDKTIAFKNESLLEGIVDYKEKIEFVLKRLTYNLVFGVSGSTGKYSVNTHYYNPVYCNCCRCAFNRFEFRNVFKNLEIETTDLKEKLKVAYIHCQVGNLNNSASLFLEIAQQAYTEKKYITYFIAKYNLKQLGSFLNNYVYNREVNLELVNKLTKIDPLEEAVKLKTHTDYDLLSFIAQEDYFSDAFQNIREAVNDIVEHYYSQLNGGWSNNQHILKLNEAFAKLETFLNSNYILFDQYSNFEKLFEAVTEGLLASHAITESQGQRLEVFDDYWVHKLMLYGKKKTILKYFYRFKLKSLRYNSSSNERDSFIDLAENLFQNNYSANTSVHVTFSNIYFENIYDKTFANTLTMASLLELNDTVLNRFGELLFAFLQTENKLSHSSIESIILFFKRKARKIDKEILYKYFTYFLYNDKFHKSEILESVIECFPDNSLEISEKDFETLVNRSTSVCDKCKEIHSPEILIDLFDKVGIDLQKLISVKIQTALEDNFNFRLYYLATLNDIIPLDKAKLFSLIKDINVNEKTYTFRSLFSGIDDYRNHYVDEILNLCFKFEIYTSAIEFQKFKEIGKYYEWLIDMNGFDYKNFNPEWVLDNQTYYYFKVMSKSEKLIRALREFLKANSHAGIEKVLLKLTNFIK